MQNPIIVGFDPGTRIAGYACLTKLDCSIAHIQAPADAPKELRLFAIGEKLGELMEVRRPTHVAIEKAWLARGGKQNPQVTIAMGEARCLGLLYAGAVGAKVIDIMPSTAKKAVTGHGHAKKWKVRRCVERITGREAMTEDEADAFAVAFAAWLKIVGKPWKRRRA